MLEISNKQKVKEVVMPANTQNNQGGTGDPMRIIAFAD